MSIDSKESMFNICVFPHTDNWNKVEGGKWKNWGEEKKKIQKSGAEVDSIIDDAWPTL